MADFDVIVIGGGNAGQATAFRTARGGKTTALVDKASGKILGAQLCAPSAPDTIHAFALAIRFRMTRAQFEDMVFAYPTATSALASTFTQY